MDCAEGDVQEGGGELGVAEAGEDERAEGVGDLGAEVVGEGHAGEEVGFGVEEGLADLGGLESRGGEHGAGLVGAETLGGLQALVGGEEVRGGGGEGEVDVDEGGGGDGEEAGGKEEAEGVSVGFGGEPNGGGGLTPARP